MILRVLLGGCIGSLIGFITNFIAIRMMFWPKKRTLGFQGLLPRYKDSFADKMADFVIQFIDYKKIVDDIINEKALSALVIRKPSNALVKALSFVISDTVETAYLKIPALRRHLVRELKSATPKIKEMFVRKIVETDIDVIINLIFKYSGREIRMIQLIGAVFGFCIGIVQPLIFH